MLLRQHATRRGGPYKGERLQPEMSRRLVEDLRRQLEDERLRDRIREWLGNGTGKVLRLQLQVELRVLGALSKKITGLFGNFLV